MEAEQQSGHAAPGPNAFETIGAAQPPPSHNPFQDALDALRAQVTEEVRAEFDGKLADLRGDVVKMVQELGEAMKGRLDAVDTATEGAAAEQKTAAPADLVGGLSHVDLTEKVERLERLVHTFLK